MSVATDRNTIGIQLSAALCDFCGGPRQLALPVSSASTVRDALAQLERDHPSVYRGVCDETGSVRQHVGVFVNELNIRDEDGLDTALDPGDTLTILPAVSGG